MQHYHYIFTGSGLSALMTVYEMLLSGKFEDKSILLIDENTKKVNDRTWCFWDENNLFDEIFEWFITCSIENYDFFSKIILDKMLFF